MSGNAKASISNATHDENRGLFAASDELMSLAHLCKEIQWAISALLEAAHHPDLNVEVHVLQDIDRMQQTLVDLARFSGEIAFYTQISKVEETELKRSIQLESLKTRLFPEEQKPSDTDSSDVTWF